MGQEDDDEWGQDPLADGFSLRPSENDIAQAESRNLVQHEVRVGLRKQFKWDDCPVWQEDRSPDERDPPWRLPGESGNGYFQITEIEQVLLAGDH